MLGFSLAFLFLSLAMGAYSPSEWRVILETPATGEPYRSTNIQVSLDGCGKTTTDHIVYSFFFPVTDSSLGEVDFATSNTASVTHEFRETGRRTVVVAACISGTPSRGSGTTITCSGGSIITTEFEFLIQYVRREVRDLPHSEWLQIVDALFIMKTNDDATMQKLYGPRAHAYDWMVAFHAKSTLNSTCDQAHVWSGFLPFHRVFCRLVEVSIQQIYPHLALPYWDQNWDEKAYTDPLSSPVWGDAFFGGSGDPTDWYIVKNGQFAQPGGRVWSIGKFRDYIDPTNYPYENPYGFLKGPWNSNPATRFTRRFNDAYGYSEKPKVQWMSLSTALSCRKVSNFGDFAMCFNDIYEGAHAWVHYLLGGGTNPSAPSMAAYDDVYQYSVKMFRSAFASVQIIQKTAICPSTCNLNDPTFTITNNAACMCTCNPSATSDAQKLVASQAAILDVTNGTFDPTYPDNLCTIGGNLGDLLDSATSPNDPVFAIFHADGDRHWMNWQDWHVASGIYGNFPVQGYCAGHGLNDIINGASGVSPYTLGLGQENNLITIRQLIDRTIPDSFGTSVISPYRYQTYSAWQGGGLQPPNTESTPDTFCTNPPSSANIIQTSWCLFVLSLILSQLF